MKTNKIDTERLEFWNSRAHLGLAAGSGDVNLKEIEMEAISKNLGAAKTVLDAGCGNSYTLLSIAVSFSKIKFFGFDYSSRMVEEGKALIKNQGLSNRIQIWQDNLLSISSASIKNLGFDSGSFDCVYTERSIILKISLSR